MGTVKASQFDINRKVRQFGFLIVITFMGVLLSMVMYAGEYRASASHYATKKLKVLPANTTPVTASF